MSRAQLLFGLLVAGACSRRPPVVPPDPRSPFERETDAVRMESVDVLLAGTSVTLKRIGLRFEIPRRWLKPYVDGHPDPANLCVRGVDFERAHGSDMHFDPLWVADEVLPFETIVCQLGPPYSAFVLRVHLLPEASPRATRDIPGASREAIRQLTAGYRPFRDARGAPKRHEWPVRERRAPWQRLPKTDDC